MTEMRFMGEVAASRGEVRTHTAASEGTASTTEMARTEAAYVSGAAEAAYASPTEPAADMSASAKPASMSPAEAATMSATAAARKRISGQSGGESGSRREDDHRLT
jgi:isocitrate lyase